MSRPGTSDQIDLLTLKWGHRADVREVRLVLRQQRHETLLSPLPHRMSEDFGQKLSHLSLPLVNGKRMSIDEMISTRIPLQQPEASTPR
jgi:hypothetical protein